MRAEAALIGVARNLDFFLFVFGGIAVLLTTTAYNSTTVPHGPKLTIEH